MTTTSPLTALSEVAPWMARHAERTGVRVERIPFDRLRRWGWQDGTGNLGHDSGRFFTVEGLELRTATHHWRQPIIVQPEVGMLGLLVKRFDGVPHVLLQAKMEPGNINQVQLSPTVQATRSNFTGVHGGAAVPHLDQFARPWTQDVLADVLQSEQGAWFLHKRNRNMIVETGAEVVHDDSARWLTLGQVLALLLCDDVVNMDTRTVLSCLPTEALYEDPDVADGPGPDDGFVGAVRASLRSTTAARHSVAELHSWLTTQRAVRELRQQRIGLLATAEHGWRCDGEQIAHDSGRYFRVVAVDVTTRTREVGSWTQPLLEPVGGGLLALLVARLDGVLHALVHTRLDAGSLTGAELAATVHCRPDNHADTAPQDRPRFLDAVLAADPADVRMDVRQSEEGGRFLAASNRYTVIEVDEQVATAAPEEFRWMTLFQIGVFVRHSNQVTVELRSMLACLHAVAASG